MLEGFEQIVFGSAGSSVSITKNGVTFNKATVDALSKQRKVEFVTLQVNKELKQFAIIPASKEDMGAIPFTSPNPKTPSVRWNNKEFLRILSNMMSWDLKKCSGYRAYGRYIKEDKAIIFDLSQAAAII